MKMSQQLAVVIMAAGKGTRMQRDDIPKVCNLILDKPLIQYVVDQAKSLAASKIICIVGHQQEVVRETLKNEPVLFAEQLEQLGTGHAVLQTADLLKDFDGDVIVLSGDVPLLKGSTLEALLANHNAGGYASTVLTALAAEPRGYGRVIRTAKVSVLPVGLANLKGIFESVSQGLTDGANHGHRSHRNTGE